MARILRIIKDLFINKSHEYQDQARVPARDLKSFHQYSFLNHPETIDAVKHLLR